MNPIKFKIIPYKEIIQFIKDESLYGHWLDEYLKHRPGILENVDIFCENCRSVNEPNKNFNLFQKVDNDPDIYVFSLYLELFEFNNKSQHIINCVHHYCNLYKDKKVVFYWNHDADFKKYKNIFEEHSNAYVINYNTSVKHNNSIIVPFWTLSTDFVEVKKQYNWGMIANIGNHLCRQNLYYTFINTPHFYYHNSLPYEEYRKKCSSFVFNFCPRGAGLSSWRFFESFHLNTIPVLFADDVLLPYENEINYNDISVRIPETKTTDYNYIVNNLINIDYKNILFNISMNRKRFTLLGVQEEVYKRLK